MPGKSLQQNLSGSDHIIDFFVQMAALEMAFDTDLIMKAHKDIRSYFSVLQREDYSTILHVLQADVVDLSQDLDEATREAVKELAQKTQLYIPSQGGRPPSLQKVLRNKSVSNRFCAYNFQGLNHEGVEVSNQEQTEASSTLGLSGWLFRCVR